jgi:hypothetical protein
MNKFFLLIVIILLACNVSGFAQIDNGGWDENFAPPVLQNPELHVLKEINDKIYFFRDGKFLIYDLASSKISYLNSLISGAVFSLANSGDTIYAAGSFTGIYQSPENCNASFIAMHDGEKWQPLGGEVNNLIKSVAVSERGNVYAGGRITSAGGKSVGYVAMWDGEEWHDMKGGVDGNVFRIITDGDRVYIGGSFENAGGEPCEGIACWNEATGEWETDFAADLGSLPVVMAIASDGDELYIGGMFEIEGVAGATNIAKWDGSQWCAIGGGLDGNVYDMGIDGNATLIAGGAFSESGSGAELNGIGRWDGNQWQSLRSGIAGGDLPSVLSIDIIGDDYFFAGGTFIRAGELSVNGIAYWRDNKWNNIIPGRRGGLSSMIYSFALGTDDRLYVGGGFKQTGDKFSPGVSCLDENGWLGLDSGLVPPAVVYDMAVMGSQVYISGWCFGSFHKEFKNVAYFDVFKREWTEVADGIPAGDSDMGPMAVAGGKVYFSGAFNEVDGVQSPHVIAWDGSEWESLGGGIINTGNQNDIPGIYDIIPLSDGRILFAGMFDRAGDQNVRNVAVWDPESRSWSDFAGGIKGFVGSVCEYGDYIYFSGKLTQAGDVNDKNIARYNKSTGEWEAMGEGVNGHVRAMVPYGEYIIIGGYFNKAGGKDASSIAAFDVTTDKYYTFGDGIRSNNMPGRVLALTVYKNDLYAGGIFNRAGSYPSANIARWNDLQTAVDFSCDIKKSDLKISPNPFTGTAELEFFAPQSDFYRIELFSVLGNRVKIIAGKELPAGQNILPINAEYLPRGLYICRIISKDFQINKKVILQ